MFIRRSNFDAVSGVSVGGPPFLAVVSSMGPFSVIGSASDSGSTRVRRSFRLVWCGV